MSRDRVPIVDPLLSARILAAELAAETVTNPETDEPETVPYKATDAEVSEEVRTDLLTALQQGRI